MSFPWRGLYKTLMVVAAIAGVIAFCYFLWDRYGGPKPLDLVGNWTVTFGKGQKGKASITVEQNNMMRITGEGQGDKESSTMEGSGELRGKELHFKYKVKAGNREWEGDAALTVVSHDHLSGHYLNSSKVYDTIEMVR